MRRSYLALLRIGAVVCATLFAQQPPPPPPAGQALSPDQLEGLVAPVALYPDPLLSQIWARLSTSKYMPTPPTKLIPCLTWTTDLGNAFLNQQSDVMEAVQRMRQKAQQGGKLASPQQQPLTSLPRPPPPPCQARRMMQFNPDKSWRPVVLE